MVSAKKSKSHNDEEEVKKTEVEIETKEKLEEQEETRKPKEVTISDIELERLRQESLDHKDKYIRGLADSENLRKRTVKEKQEISKFAVRNVVADLLHPLDQMESALKFADQGSEEVKHWAVGFKMILTHFKDALANHGIHTFDSHGQQFDPHRHEAIEMIETNDHPEGMIVEEIVKGYLMGDHLVRAARVKVAKKIEEKKEEQKENPDEKSENN